MLKINHSSLEVTISQDKYATVKCWNTQQLIIKIATGESFASYVYNDTCQREIQTDGNISKSK